MTTSMVWCGTCSPEPIGKVAKGTDVRNSLHQGYD